MTTIAAIFEIASGVLKLCNKCCEADPKDKKDPDEDIVEEVVENAESTDSEGESDNEEEKEKTNTASTSKKQETKSAKTCQKKKTRIKRSVQYVAVKQNEPQQATMVNNFTPNVTFINQPYASPAYQPSLPGYQACQPLGGPSTEQNPSVIEWVDSTIVTAANLLDRAVIGGYDIDDSNLLIIRVDCKGALIPGKLNLKWNLAFVAKDNAEKNTDEFQVCCCITSDLIDRIKWISCGNGTVPKNAVVGGRTATGEKLYIGRQMHKDEVYTDRSSLCPGWIQPTRGVLYVTYNLKVHAHQFYEAMCIE